MTDPVHQQLLGHLLGALDDDEQAWLDARLEHDGERLAELARWRRRLSPLEAVRPDVEPPPWLVERTCRLVAAYGARPSRLPLRYRGMSPDPGLPAHNAGRRWPDVLAVAALLLVVVAITAAALHENRFRASVASCQNRLRQLGMALTEYNGCQGGELGQLADDGKLTRAGRLAAEQVRNRLIFDANWNACPDAWLAAQGALCMASHAPKPLDRLSPLGTIVPGRLMLAGFSYPAESLASLTRFSSDSADGFPYSTQTPSDDLAFLSDVPDASNQVLDGHGGQGRNLFFEDGHVDFVPSPAARATTESVLFPSDATVPEIFTPANAAEDR